MKLDLSGDAGTLLDECIAGYDSVVRNISAEAKAQSDRAFGGMVRAGKGSMGEDITRNLLRAAWLGLGEKPERMLFNLQPKYDIPIRREYAEKIADADLRRKMLANLGEYKIKHGTDIHVYIDRVFVLSVECKAYAENAMLKKILFDAFLLGTLFPKLRFALVQMESQLGGDYGASGAQAVSGSPQSHTLMSYMDSVDLHIITLLEGDRKVKRPIHNPKFYKPLRRERLEQAALVLAKLLSP